MSNPDQIRADIEMTRDELGRDVDALADKVSPPKIMERQRARVREVLGDVKGRVMGVADDAVDAAGDAVKDLPDKAARAAHGAPLTVGLLAAGLGYLVASLLPPTDAERRWAVSLRDQAQPLVDKAMDEAKGAAQELAEGLKEPAMAAVDEVKESAVSSAETVKEEAQSTAEQVKESVAENVSAGTGASSSEDAGGSGEGPAEWTDLADTSDASETAEPESSGWQRLG